MEDSICFVGDVKEVHIDEEEKYNPTETAKERLKREQELHNNPNLVMVLATDYTLQLDIDTPDARKQFDRFFELFKDIVETAGEPVFTESKSGNTHITIHLVEPLTPALRVACQAALVGDGKRELLNLRRIALGLQDAICLFELKPPVEAAGEGR